MIRYRDFTKAAVKAILEQAPHYKWSVQGLGMMRLYLSTEVRLHIWHSSLMVPDVTLVHDHPWHFESVVVEGKLTNRRYFTEFRYPGDRRVPDGVYIGGPEFFIKHRLFCGPGGCLEDESERVILHKALKADEICSAGDGYSQSKDQIHYTLAQDGTVTLVYRQFDGDRDHANVYCKGGRPFVSAEPRPAAPEEVDFVVRDTMQKWFSQGG